VSGILTVVVLVPQMDEVLDCYSIEKKDAETENLMAIVLVVLKVDYLAV
jgi:hypothetical protein